MGTGGAAANRSGRREAATDGSCQQGTNSKTEESATEIMEREREKSTSYVLVSSFQLKENLLSSDQRNSSAKADGEHPCGAIRAGEFLQLKITAWHAETWHSAPHALQLVEIWVH